MALNHGPEQHYENIPQKNTLSQEEQMRQLDRRNSLSEARKGLGNLGEEIESKVALQKAKESLSSEEEAEQLATTTLAKSAEWNARRTDAVLTRKVMNQSMEKVLNSTETEIKQRRLGFQRSRFNI